ncbi:APC family permease [soil metagenome]
MSSSEESKTTDSLPALQRTLGGWQILFYGLGSMLGAGIYALVGKAATDLGNAVWLAFLMAMVAAILTGLSYASVGSRYARAGGASFVTQHAFRKPMLSYIIGLAVMMSGLTSMATGSQAIAENLQRAFDWDIPTKFLAIAIVAMIGAVIYRGIRESMWLNLVCTVVEAGGLLFIIAVGMKYWGSVNYLETPHDLAAGGVPGSGITFSLVLQGAVLTFFSFIGFEDILNVSEEVKNPKKDIPFGLIGAMIAATLIYIAVSITAVSVLGWEELSTAKAPLMEVAHRAAPWFGGIDKFFGAITIFAIGNTALLNYLMGSRLLYGMSRQGLLPRILGNVHPRRHTPHVAIFVLFGIVCVLILAGGIKALAEATVLLLLGVFVCVNLSLLVLQRRTNEPRGGFEISSIIPLLGSLVCALLLGSRLLKGFITGNQEDFKAPFISLIIIVTAAALYFILKPKAPIENVSPST